ncbi:MAG TPA: SRPBCC family protein [Pyrinomonadaceae bacterium]|nr:SRPBCC family protein [Pyrinomonadaceae bacterium]
MRLAVTIGLTAIAIVALAVLVIAFIGWRLPKQHSATRSILLHKSPAEVYGVSRDFASMPKWRADVRGVIVTTSPDGRVHFREDGKQGSVNYELAEDVPGQRMVTRITDNDLGYSGQWSYVFAAQGDNTRVVISEDAEVSNVIFRFLSRYAFGHTATMDAYLISLGKQFGEKATPE